jgi:tRNA(Ile)-lysidine synthase
VNIVSETVAAALAEINPEAIVFIGFSGGLDSTVLAHAIATTWPQAHKRVQLVHVNHKLQTAADAWAGHCREFARQLGLALSVQTIHLKPNAAGLEDAARRARYQAIGALMPADAVLLTAHHQQDQAETVLMRVLSGAGPRGAGAMRRETKIFGLHVVRPLLGLSKTALRAYAHAHHLRWVEDPSNQDTRFTRNRVRHWLSQLQTELPRVSESLAQFAEQAQCDQALIAHFAQAALKRAQAVDDTEASATKLHIPILMSEMTHLRPWILRSWLKDKGVHSSELVRASLGLCLQTADRGEARVRLKTADETYAFVRRYQNALYLSLEKPDVWPLNQTLCWNLREAEYVLPAGLGRLRLLPEIGPWQTQTSLSLELNIRNREGGERIRLPGRLQTHALKDVLQQFKVPPWQRKQLILLIFPDTSEVAAVRGLTISARLQELLTQHRLRLVPN